MRHLAAAAAALAALQLLLLLPPPAFGHGVLVMPPSRNWKAYLEQNFEWAHGLNMGGEIRGQDLGPPSASRAGTRGGQSGRAAAPAVRRAPGGALSKDTARRLKRAPSARQRRPQNPLEAP